MGKGNSYTAFVEKPEGKSLVEGLVIKGNAVLKSRTA